MVHSAIRRSKAQAAATLARPTGTARPMSRTTRLSVVKSPRRSAARAEEEVGGMFEEGKNCAGICETSYISYHDIY
ncbi:hypothetical protein D3C77_786560 [compost metagenome]